VATEPGSDRLEERDMQRIDVAPDIHKHKKPRRWQRFLRWINEVGESDAGQRSREIVGRVLNAAPAELAALAERQQVANIKTRADTEKALAERRAIDSKERREEALFDLELEQRRAEIEKTKAETMGLQFSNAEKAIKLFEERGFAVDIKVINGVPNIFAIDAPQDRNVVGATEDIELKAGESTASGEGRVQSELVAKYDHTEDWDPILECSVTDLAYNERISKKLEDTNLVLIGDLVARTEADLLSDDLVSISTSEIAELQDVLASHGLSLGMLSLSAWKEHRKLLK